jgi:hypothetical protein
MALVEVTNAMKIKFVRTALLLVVAEVLSSFFVWRGAPMDGAGPPPRFWTFEMWRLEYWAIFFSPAALLWVVSWYGVHRRVGAIGMGLLGAVLAVATEVLTSVWYWRQFTWSQASYLGWSYFTTYFWEHLISWFVVVSVGAALWYIWNKRRGGQRGKTALGIVALLVLCVPSLAQDTAYYTAIQKASSPKMQPAQFKKIEEDALKDFSRPESYELLATSFGNTTEKVWAVIYGEIYCNLSVDADRISQVGSLIYQWYEGSLSRQGNGLSANLTENAQSSQKQVPFESLFEQAYLMGAVGVKSDFPPLSIQRLSDIRKNQLLLWGQKKLPETELVRWQEAIMSAGHFDAYNYWLFKGARAEEFNEWMKGHQAQFQAWLDWRRKNRFQVLTPDFQRLYLLRKPTGNATPVSLIHEAGHAEGIPATVDSRTPQPG